MYLAFMGWSESVTIGDVITLLVLLSGFSLIYLKSRQDVRISLMQEWIDVHEEDSRQDRIKLEMLRDAVTRLTALQETSNARMKQVEGWLMEHIQEKR